MDLDFQIQNIKKRYCPICAVKFCRVVDLDQHRYNSHRHLYFPSTYRPVHVDSTVNSNLGLRFSLNQEAFDVAREYVLDFSGIEFHDVMGLFHTIRGTVSRLLLDTLNEMRGFTVLSALDVDMFHPLKDIRDTFFLYSFAHRIMDESMIHPMIDLMAHKIYDSVLTLTIRSSNWVVEKISKFAVSVIPYDPIGGGERFQLPPALARKKCVVSVDNGNDEKCFLWSICAELNPLYRHSSKRQRGKATKTSSYAKEMKKLHTYGLEFPVSVKQIPKFLRQNPDLSINVIGCEPGDSNERDPETGELVEELELFPLYICKEVKQKHIDLLLVDNGTSRHYCLLKQRENDNQVGLSCLLGRSGRARRYFCYYCLSGFLSTRTRDNHVKDCSLLKPCRVKFPNEPYYDFNRFDRTLEVPYMAVYDFESVLKPIMRDDCPDGNQCTKDVCSMEHPGSTVQVAEHIPCGYSLLILDSKGTVVAKDVYRGEDADVKFLERAIELSSPFFHELSQRAKANKKPPKLTRADFLLREQTTHCFLCKRPFGVYDQKCAHHNHLVTDQPYLGFVHQKCNFQAKLKVFIPFYGMNSSAYDNHYVLRAAANVSDVKDVSAIAQTREKFMSISIKTKQGHHLKFNDLYRLMPSSLDKLVEARRRSGLGSFSVTRQLFPNLSDDHFDLLTKKLSYPYEYISDFTRFDETELPAKEYFFSALKNKGIDDAEYERTKKIWEVFGLQTLGDMHNLYVLTDSALAADCLLGMREMIKKNFEFDVCNFISLPSLAFDIALLLSKTTFEFIRDIDTWLFFESMVRGGLSLAVTKKVEANNKYLKDFDETKPSTYLTLFDFTNLYGFSLTKPLPTHGFQWLPREEYESKSMEELTEWIMSLDDNGDIGFCFEVDVTFPPETHDYLNQLPPFPTKSVVDYESLSEYTKTLMRDYGLDEKSLCHEKLVTTLQDKKGYRVHFRVLKLYLSLGAKLTACTRIIKFVQRAWAKDFVEFCANMRADKNNTEFERQLWKALVCSLYGKLIEQKRKHRNVRFALNKKEALFWAKKPTMEGFQILFNGKMVVFFLKKLSVTLDRFPASGTCVLDDSKASLFGYFYNYLYKYYGREKVTLALCDTDSILSLVQTEDYYKDMKRIFDAGDKTVDLCVYEKCTDSRKDWLFNEEVRGVLGKIKDEFPALVLSKAVVLASKLYALQGERPTADGPGQEKLDVASKAKGVCAASREEHLRFAAYEACLESDAAKDVPCRTFRSFGHNIFTVETNKRGASCLETKRFWYDRYNSMSFGHYKIGEFM